MIDTILEFFQANGADLFQLTVEHIGISAISVGLGMIVAVPLGVLLTRTDKLATVVMAISSILQTIPSLALLALMVPLFGVGVLPAVIALFLYSLMPILRNTYYGIKNVDPDLVDAAKGMGMTSWQILRKVEIPQASGIIMTGIRLSTVYVIAWATLASYIGAGGLGDFIFNGLSIYIPELIISGAVAVMVIALIADYLLGLVEKRLTPVNLREGQV